MRDLVDEPLVEGMCLGTPNDELTTTERELVGVFFFSPCSIVTVRILTGLHTVRAAEMELPKQLPESMAESRYRCVAHACDAVGRFEAQGVVP